MPWMEPMPYGLWVDSVCMYVDICSHFVLRDLELKIDEKN